MQLYVYLIIPTRTEASIARARLSYLIRHCLARASFCCGVRARMVFLCANQNTEMRAAHTHICNLDIDDDFARDIQQQKNEDEACATVCDIYETFICALCASKFTHEFARGSHACHIYIYANIQLAQV